MTPTLTERTGFEHVRRASNPRSQIKTVYWRGDVIDVVNRFFSYELVSRPIPKGQEWTRTWRKSVERSIAQINKSKGIVHESDDDFLAALRGE